MTIEAVMRAHVSPLDDPETAWCDEHLLPCLVRQHFVIEVQIGDGPIVPLEIVRCEDHA